MQKPSSKTRAITFFLILALPTVVWLVLALAGKTDAFRIDTNENRNLHELASDVSVKNLTQELEAVYNDHLPFRSVLLKAHQSVDNLIERPYSNEIEPFLISLVNKARGSQADASADSGFYPFRLLGDEVIQGREGWLFLYTTLFDYQYTRGFSDETKQTLAAEMTELRDRCAARGINVKYLFLPNKNSVYPEYMPTIEKSERSNLLDLESYIHENTDVDLQYVYEEMYAEKQHHQLYFKLDTHWNAYGSLVGINTFYTMLGMPVITEDQLDPTSAIRPSGDLSILAGGAYTGNEPDIEWMLNYKPDIFQTIRTAQSDYGDYLFEAWSDAPNDQTVVIVGDSFSYRLRDFLLCDFNHVIYVSFEMLDKIDPALITQADILLVENVERNVVDYLPATMEKLLKIF